MLYSFNASTDKSPRDRLRACYQLMKQKLLSKLHAAKASGKPLLILIGEEHKNIYSHLVEEMISYIGASYLNIKDIAVEMDNWRYYFIRYLGSKQANEEAWIELEAIAKKLNCQFHLIDPISFIQNLCNQYYMGWITAVESAPNHPFFKDVNLDDIVSKTSASDQQVIKRNEHIAENLIAIHRDTIAIVGALHIKGLIPELEKYFHVIAFDALPRSSMKYGCVSGSRATEFFHDYAELKDGNFNKDEIFELLSQVHQEELANAKEIESKSTQDGSEDKMDAEGTETRLKTRKRSSQDATKTSAKRARR